MIRKPSQYGILYVCVSLMLVMLLLVFGCSQPASTTQPASKPTTTVPASHPASSAPTSAAANQAHKTESWATMGIQTSLYVAGSALSPLISKYSGYMDITVLPCTTGTAMFQMTASKTALLGYTNSLDLPDAIKGIGEIYAGKAMPNLRPVFGGEDLQYVFYVKNDPSISSLKGLKGKKLAIGFPPGNGSTRISQAVVNYFGWQAGKDYQSIPEESHDTATQDIIAGRADATIGALGGSKTLQAITSGKVKFLSFDDTQMVQTLVSKTPGLFSFPVAAGDYPGVDRPFIALGAKTLVCTYDGANENDIYTITKIIAEHAPETYNIGASMKFYAKDRMAVPYTVPFHPGAIKYYKEANLWTNQMETANNAAIQWLNQK